MGPGALEHRGAQHLRLCEGFLVHTSTVSGSDSAWPLRSSPANVFKLSKTQWGWQLLMTSTAPGPCAEQGHRVDPAASCSSPSVGLRTCVRSCCVPPWSYDLGRQCLRSGEPNAP